MPWPWAVPRSAWTSWTSRTIPGLILRRLLVAVPLIWLGATLTFVVVQAAPGSFAELLAAEHGRLPPTTQAMLVERYGLDQPVPVQYLRWLRAVASGDLGDSFLYRRPVTEIVGQAVGPTLQLAVPALALNLALGLLLAMTATRRPHGWADRTITVLGLGLYGVPSFWIAGLAVLVLCRALGWLPASHMSSIGAEQLAPLAWLVDRLRHMVLPVTCLGLMGAVATARYLRSTLLELRGARFLVAARARGLPERRVRWVHTLRPALLPVVTLLGLSLPLLLSGSVVIESIFSWPGLGQVLWRAALARDVPLIMATTMLGFVAVVLGSLVADLLYAVVDPRARDEAAGRPRYGA
jgi:peptide/nickel transport system permease protein